jgi:hypothetical protein
MKDKIGFGSKLTLKLTDNNTSELTKIETVQRSQLENGSRNVIYGLTNTQTPNAITRVIIFDSDKNPVKIIDGTWGDPYVNNNTVYIDFTADDNSSDTYEIKYMELHYSYAQPIVWGTGYFFYKLSVAQTKGSDQTLSITWTIKGDFSTAP